VLIVPEYAWVELEQDMWRELWRDFVDGFGFSRASSPVINEPVPSIAWALPDGPFPEAARPVAQLVCDVLRECVEHWDSVFQHDAAHPSRQYRPHRVTNIDGLKNWEYSHCPNGDYMIFVSRDHMFGVLGDPFENTICFFGAPAGSVHPRSYPTGEACRSR
jgi:Protein of unknown function (DUF2716)